jgi:hypothetical protein
LISYCTRNKVIQKRLLIKEKKKEKRKRELFLINEKKSNQGVMIRRMYHYDEK